MAHGKYTKTDERSKYDKPRSQHGFKCDWACDEYNRRKKRRQKRQRLHELADLDDYEYQYGRKYDNVKHQYDLQRLDKSRPWV